MKSDLYDDNGSGDDYNDQNLGGESGRGIMVLLVHAVPNVCPSKTNHGKPPYDVTPQK
jgi:hypothetical protein